MNNMEPSSVEENRSFRVRDEYDFTFIHEVAEILGCSQSTIYRTLIKAKIPIYHLPNRKGLAILHAATLWRLAVTPAFKKYVRRLGIQPYKIPIQSTINSEYPNGTTIEKAIEMNLLPLTSEQAYYAYQCGLLPTNENILEPWFCYLLANTIQFPFPQKKKHP